jgi:hypothetical protein
LDRYISDDGILPYASCDSLKDRTAASLVTQGKFVHDGKELRLLVVAASVFGASSESGKPLLFSSVEFLVFFKNDGVLCTLDGGLHCKNAELPNNSPFQITCEISGLTVAGKLKWFPELAVISCPFPANTRAMPDNWNVMLKVGNGLRKPLRIPICYQHVQRQMAAGVCTSALYGWDAQSLFWAGFPKYKNHTLMDAFLIYHVFLMGSFVRVNDLETELEEFVASRSLGGTVSYRGSWNALLPHPHPYAMEYLVVASCIWDFRLRVRFTHILNPDSFAWGSPWRNYTGMLENLRAEESAVLIPMRNAFRGEILASDNVILQFPLLSPVEIGNTRQAPFFNPRHLHFAKVHWVEPNERANVVGDSSAAIQHGFHYLHFWNLRGENLTTQVFTLNVEGQHIGQRLQENIRELLL